jgi:hypothetical protein
VGTKNGVPVTALIVRVSALTGRRVSLPTIGTEHHVDAIEVGLPHDNIDVRKIDVRKIDVRKIDVRKSPDDAPRMEVNGPIAEEPVIDFVPFEESVQPADTRVYDLPLSPSGSYARHQPWAFAGSLLLLGSWWS